jgi:hypothetical protein
MARPRSSPGPVPGGWPIRNAKRHSTSRISEGEASHDRQLSGYSGCGGRPLRCRLLVQRSSVSRRAKCPRVRGPPHAGFDIARPPACEALVGLLSEVAAGRPVWRAGSTTAVPAFPGAAHGGIHRRLDRAQAPGGGARQASPSWSAEFTYGETGRPTHGGTTLPSRGAHVSRGTTSLDSHVP